MKQQQPLNLTISGKSTLVFILGVLSIIACSIWYLGILLSLATIILGYHQVKTTGRRSARWGLTLGILGLCFTLLIYFLATAIIFSATGYLNF